MKSKHSNASGSPAFSLVELSIVLVILGLLVGGIMTGQNLIKAAELRAIGTEYDKYITALNIFRDKYRALPGDMGNAEAFWQTAPNCPGTALQGTTDGTTCDGNGNGRIEISEYAGSNEHFRAWQHLANAGLIEGVYTGVTGPDEAHWHTITGTNIPRSKFGNAGWDIYWGGDRAGSSFWFATDYGHLLMLGVDEAWGAWQPMITPEELWNLDTKMDDGKPGRGRILPHGWDECTDATGFGDLDAAYLLSETGAVCSIIFRNII